MAGHELLIALALLIHPEPLADGEEAKALFYHVAPTVRRLAIRWEVLDRREKQDLLTDPRQFAADIAELRRRLRELATAPSVAECERFPDRDTICAFLAANRMYREELVQRLLFERVYLEEVRQALDETDRLYRLWDTLRDAGCKYYYVTVRRRALMDLRELVGARAFNTGELPPHVPVWRMPRRN